MATHFVTKGKLKADPIAVYFPSQELRDQVTEYAKDTGRSASALFIVAVTEFMKRNPGES